MTEQTPAVFTPYDVSFASSRQVKATILLARAFGWNVIQSNAGPTTIVSKDGHKIRLPDNVSSIKDSVFKGWINQIFTHTENPTLTQSVAARIAAESKLHPEHLRIILGHVNQKDDKWITVIRDSLDEKPDHERVRSTLPPAPAEPVPAEPHILSEGVKEILWGNRYFPSEYLIERRWSDGTIDYQCKICGLIDKSTMVLGMHRKHLHPEVRGDSEDRYERVHAANPQMKAYPDEHRQAMRKTKGKPIPATPVAEVARPEPPPVTEQKLEPGPMPERSDIEAVAEMVRDLINAATFELQEQLAEVMAERDGYDNSYTRMVDEKDSWRQRAEKAEGDLDALRDLLGGPR